MKYLVTGWAEYYQYVDADSQEEAFAKLDNKEGWSRTMNLPLQNIKAEHVLTCGCSWIDSKGEPTPDSNLAIAMAVCYDPSSYSGGESLQFGEQGSKPFPICAEHAARKTKWWKLLPLPGQEMKDAHLLVQRDDREFKVIPDVVSRAIHKAFPKDANDILQTLRWSGDHFSFIRWGTYVGVELDGYIHS